MSKVAPKQVTDKSKRTKVFDWTVPMQVGSTTGSVKGTLFWAGSAGGGTPVAAYGGLAAIALLGLGAVMVVRRRRAGGAPVGTAEVEAW
jgi:hypothetical protein